MVRETRVTYEITVKGFQCLQCGYRWPPRNGDIEERPGKCPRCKSLRWDKEGKYQPSKRG